MKIKLWVINSAIPGGVEPVFPKVCVTEAEAEAYVEEMMRGEWAANGPFSGDTGERLPYPGGAWRDVQDIISADDTDGERWGRWEITSHEIVLDVRIRDIVGIDQGRHQGDPAVVAEEHDKIMRRLVTPLRDALKIGREGLHEVIYSAVYDAQHGEEPDPNDACMKALAAMDAALALADGQRPVRDDGNFDRVAAALAGNPPPLGKIAVIIDGGMVQEVVADGALIGLSVTIIDYDTDGAGEGETEDVDQGDGTAKAAYIGQLNATKATIVIPGDEPLDHEAEDQAEKIVDDPAALAAYLEPDAREERRFARALSLFNDTVARDGTEHALRNALLLTSIGKVPLLQSELRRAIDALESSKGDQPASEADLKLAVQLREHLA